ncbi:RE1 [Symbiodinium sp. KB8]|nr:RE1 [Symbiodinium sp. KB8]
MARLESDRYGVPQYSGEPDTCEEYQERAWDLFHGREGSDQLQLATPVHLRAGLTGAAYDAVRKLAHEKLKTKTSDGKVTDAGMKLLLQTLKENIATEAPVKVNELFLNAFYSPGVWRQPGETMQQYIVRREQDLKRLEEVLPGSAIPDHLRALMLLVFGGLDRGEQMAILASVGNDYDFKKIGHALRIQFPNSASKPVHRRDYLGCGRAGSPSSPQRFRPRPPKGKAKGKGQYAYAALEEDQDYESDAAIYDDAFEAADLEEETYQPEPYDEQAALEAMIQDYDFAEDQELAEAYATIFQKKTKKGQPPQGKGQQAYPFRAQGEIAFDQKGKDNKRNAIKFLKQVTPCTSCGMKGHWAGDPECPQKGKGAKTNAKKKVAPKKKGSFYVAPEYPETAEEQFFADSTSTPLPSSTAAPLAMHGVTFTNASEFSEKALAESYMTLRNTDLCEHSSYRGGDEKKFHRSGNAHTRGIRCKEPECNRAVISGRRRQAVTMWSFLVQVAITTLWGRRARSRALAQRIAVVRAEAQEEKEEEERRAREIGLIIHGPDGTAHGGQTPPGAHDWRPVLQQPKDGYSPTATELSSSSSAAPRARILRQPRPGQQAWVYGVCLSPDAELPKFPELAPEDADIMVPLLCDSTTLGTESPFPGFTYEVVASSPEGAVFCTSVMHSALTNQLMQPEIYRFAFYLFGRLQLLRGGVLRMSGQGGESRDKREATPGTMITSRVLQAPVAMDRTRFDIVSVQDCEVMMTTECQSTSPARSSSTQWELVEDTQPEQKEGSQDPEALVLEQWEVPGLAILDSGCTKTMHGSKWAARFAGALRQKGLGCETRACDQKFKGVGGDVASSCLKVYPIGIKGIHGELVSCETEGNLPMLLSRAFMEQQGTVLDIGAGTVSFEKIGVKELPLVRTAKGHFAVDLLDYDLNRLTDFTDAAANSSLLVLGDPYLSLSPAEAFAEMDRMMGGDSPEVPEGWNPDDWQDHLAKIALWKADTENSNLEVATADVSDEAHYFETVLVATPTAMRKTTSKKGKKIDAMNATLDGTDLLQRQVLEGKSRVSRRPPHGKTWLKQIFSGSVGLSVLCACAGVAVGAPLGIWTTGWDYSGRSGIRHVHQDLQKEDPYLLVITQPFGNSKKEETGDARNHAAIPPHFKDDAVTLTNKIVRDRVKANRHVLIEQPDLDEWLADPDLKDVANLLSAGSLVRIDLDGCQVGYKDPATSMPIKRPTVVLTSLLVAVEVMQGYLCDGEHQHHRGSHGTAEEDWPHYLNKLVFDTLAQQALVEHHAVPNVKEAFPVEPSPRPKRRRSVLTDQSNAPPVYLPPDLQVQPPVPIDDGDRILAELVGDYEPPATYAPGDDTSARAIQTAELEPTLNIPEGERRRLWLQAPPEVRKVLRDLHVQFGHPTTTTMVRILRRTGAKLEVIRAAQHQSCDSCGESMRRKRQKPTKLPSKYVFNHHLQLDTFYARDCQSVLYSFLNIIDEATGFQVVCALGQAIGPPASRAILRHFLSSWSSWAGLPHSIQVDLGKEYMADFANYLNVRRAAWKEIFVKTVHEMQLTGLLDVQTATGVVTQCRNSFPRTSGYAPVQWVLGVPQVRLPGSLEDDSERERLEVMEAAEDPSSEMARTLAIREAAKVAQIKLDTDGQKARLLVVLSLWVPTFTFTGHKYHLEHLEPFVGMGPREITTGSNQQPPAYIPGTDIPALPELLPPVPEDDEDEGNLGNPGAAPHEQQQQRTGVTGEDTAAAPMEGVTMGEQGGGPVGLPHSAGTPSIPKLARLWEMMKNVPAETFMTGRAGRNSEVKLANLDKESRARFDASMGKEWASWQKFSAVEELTQKQIEDLPKDVKIIGTRWVHTDKNEKLRLLAMYMAKRTGKTKEQIEKEFPFEAKSRLVVQGCQEDPQNIRSDSPTASLLAFNLVCSVAMLKGWVITACDASTAYLQSQGISRLLLLRPPRPPPPGVSPHALFRARGSIYGTKDAGRAWWRKLWRTLKKHCWSMSRIEAALFYLFEGEAFKGILVTHVDDLFSAGEGEKYEATIAEMEKELHLKVKRGEFRFCGKNVHQTEDAIILDQYDAIEGVDYFLLDKDRRKQVNAPLTETEKSLFRGLIGQMGWITRQARPDLMVNVSMAAQSMGHPTVKDIINLNKAVKMLKESSDARWCFRKSEMNLENATVFCFADSSFANKEDLKSQAGYIIGFTTPEITSGNTVPIHILETHSGSIKRVCRSTLAAEANGFLSGVEAAEYLRAILLEITNPGVTVRALDTYYLKSKIVGITDAKSLESTLNKSTGQPTDKRVRILVAQIKELLGEDDYSDQASAFAHWVDTSQMLADVLTKLGCEREPILEAMEKGQWRLAPSEEASLKKLAIQAGRQSRKARSRAKASADWKVPPGPSSALDRDAGIAAVQFFREKQLAHASFVEASAEAGEGL